MKGSFLLPIAVILCTTCCGPIPDLRDLTRLDAYPPVLQSLQVVDEASVRLDFDEPCSFIGTPLITPNLETTEIRSDNTSIIIDFTAPQEPGRQYYLDGSVRDERGNSTDFILHFYGFNPHVPGILINEFTTQGSAKHPDTVELFVTAPGNSAGMCVYEGTSLSWDHMYVLPSVDLEAGDFLLIHFKPQGISEEIDETENTDLSGGYDTHPDAYDFWVPGGSGLSGNNGVLSLYSSPRGTLADSVLYSNRTSASDETYRGFGTLKVLERAEELHRLGGWKAAGDLIAPEDAVNPDLSTATRSICRSGIPEDTDCAADWHIVPTSGFTFGTINNDGVHVP